jgi:hypothetical protein
VFKSIDQYKANMFALNQKINSLEQEKYNIAKQKDQTIEILNKEINKGVNVNYLKNVLISYFTTKEESVRIYHLILLNRFKMDFCQLYLLLYNLTIPK